MINKRKKKRAKKGLTEKLEGYFYPFLSLSRFVIAPLLQNKRRRRFVKSVPLINDWLVPSFVFPFFTPITFSPLLFFLSPECCY
ncbi:hypothetical protein BKA57DRAFT_452248 [Linnemannia elongata]|nr:hypothetical protein BKA57DRAFT_452248 [Linnemannia elongata]